MVNLQGKICQQPTNAAQELVYTITTKGRLSEASEFENIIICSNADGSALRLKDVARVQLGAKDYDFMVDQRQTCHVSRYFLAAQCECAGPSR